MTIATAIQMDYETSKAIEQLSPELIDIRISLWQDSSQRLIKRCSKVWA